MNYNNNSFRFADYGTTITKPETLALLRGTGNFNPGPNYEQSINRSYNPLEYYSNSEYHQYDQNLKTESNKENEKNTKWIPFYDNDNNKKYVVGSTDMYSDNKPWSRPDFENSRGTDQYQIWALNSMKIVPNILLNLFFSEDNVNFIQNTLINEVKNITNEKISKQSDDELLIIMRNKYLYAIQGGLPSAGDINKPMARGTIINSNGLAYDNTNSGGCTSLELQLSRLNQSVIEECLKMILSGILAYKKYYQDSSSLPMQLSHPVYVSMKGSNVLQEPLGFESGHDMSTSIASYNQRFNII